MNTGKIRAQKNSPPHAILKKPSRKRLVRGSLSFLDGGLLALRGERHEECSQISQVDVVAKRFWPGVFPRRFACTYVLASANLARAAFESSPIPNRNHAMRELPSIWRQHAHL